VFIYGVNATATILLCWQPHVKRGAEYNGVEGQGRKGRETKRTSRRHPRPETWAIYNGVKRQRRIREA
jgi:hypothetical protein